MNWPKLSKQYWLWVHIDGEWYITTTYNFYDNSDIFNIEIGNCFKTYKECAAHPEVRDRLSKHIAKEPTL